MCLFSQRNSWLVLAIPLFHAACRHKDAWILIHEAVISFILNKGGAEENNEVKLPPEGASELVYKVLRLP